MALGSERKPDATRCEFNLDVGAQGVTRADAGTGASRECAVVACALFYFFALSAYACSSEVTVTSVSLPSFV